MTQTQIAAAKVLLAKTIPDLKQTELIGDPDRPVAITEVTRKIVGG